MRDFAKTGGLGENLVQNVLVESTPNRQSPPLLSAFDMEEMVHGEFGHVSAIYPLVMA